MTKSPPMCGLFFAESATTLRGTDRTKKKTRLAGGFLE
jgi:hypothetical protein